MCLVNQQNDFFTAGLLFNQEGIQHVDQIFCIVTEGLDAKFLDDGFEQLFGAHFGIENISRLYAAVQAFKKCSAKRGFPGSDLSGNFDESVALGDRIIQMGHGFLVAFA